MHPPAAQQSMNVTTMPPVQAKQIGANLSTVYLDMVTNKILRNSGFYLTT